MPGARPRELADATTMLLQLAQGESHAEQLLQLHLARLNALQPQLHAASHILREDAMRQWEAVSSGPLTGLPCSLKETIGMAGQPVYAGSNYMRPWVPTRDSPVVTRLKAAGAVIVARGNVPEFAMTAETTSPRHGVTRNPLAPERTAGGSSGGDAALVASGAVAFGIGSDILGSIRIPAACCGVVGFKPSSSAVPKQHSWPQIDGFTDSWLAIGPITRSVRDARLVYQVLAQTALPTVPSLEGLRLIRAEGFPLQTLSPCIDQALAAARKALTVAGMQSEGQCFDEVASLQDLIAPMILHDMQADWYEALESGGRPFHLLAEAWRQLTGRPGIDHGLFVWLLYGATLGRFAIPRSAAHAARLVGRFQTVRELYRDMLGHDGILLLPTMGWLAPPHGEMNRRTLRPGLNRQISPLALCNYADLPAIAVPAWSFADPVSGLPPSLMLVAAPGQEARLLAVAERVEQSVNPC
ncbi:MAG: amidase [Paludibacterium sp.]|uniref:amidase n=1 Tax=Paludibacterium sp. TaxID=1917523 RepID=UPI0025D3F6AA|nr:amidase [Paludibacterium sp.]MBV8046937.1 amidase [Paludibacterium sp.]MBV8646530.1 amidase [Paludibacterium sp.]